MTKWTRILAAVQVDSSSEAVLEQTAQLALWSGAEVTLAHVFETPGYEGPAELVPEQGRVDVAPLTHWRSAKTMAGMMNALMDRGVKVQAGLMQHGIIEEELLKSARQGDFHLLVIGNHKPSRLERALSGDLVGTLVRGALCPVLVVPHP